MTETTDPGQLVDRSGSRAPDAEPWYARSTMGWQAQDKINKAAQGIVVLQAIVVYLLIQPGSLYADDFREGSRAVIAPWSADWLLGIDTYRHFSPIMRGFYSLLGEVAPLNYAVGSACAVAMLCLTTWVLWRLLRAFVGPTKLALAALIVFVLSSMTVSVTMWVAQSIVTLPVVIGGLIAGHGLLRYVQSGRNRYLGELVFGYVLALLTWEKGIIIPAILAAVMICFIAPDWRIRELIAQFRQTWQAWAALVVLSIAYLVFWFLGGFGTDSPAPSVVDVVYGFVSSFVELLTPSVVGGPWNWYTPGPTSFYPIAETPALGVAFAFALIAALFAIAWRRNSNAVIRCASFIVWVAAFSVVLPLIGRFGQFGISVAYEPRYILDALPWTVLAAAVLANKVVPQVIEWSRGAVAAASTVAVLVVLGAGLSDARLLSRWWENPAGEYISAARTSISTMPSSVALFDTEVPPTVQARWFWPFSTSSLLLLPATKKLGTEFGTQPANAMLTPEGEVVRAGFKTVRKLPLLGCVPIKAEPTILEVPSQYHLSNMTLKLTTKATSETWVNISSSRGDGVWREFYEPATESTQVVVPQGEFSTQFLLTPPSGISELRFAGDESSGACVAALEIGQVIQTQ